MKLLLMFIDLFHGTVDVSNYEYIASDGQWLVKDELERIMKAAVVT